MKLLTILILVGLIPFFAKSQNCFYQIDFQEAFLGDTVSFFIDGMPLFENQILTTLKHRGRTDLKILLINNGENNYIGISTFDINGEWDKKGLFIEQQFYPFAYD